MRLEIKCWAPRVAVALDAIVCAGPGDYPVPPIPLKTVIHDLSEGYVKIWDGTQWVTLWCKVCGA